MTSAEAAALRELMINGNSDVPTLDPSRLAKAFVAIRRRSHPHRAENASDSGRGAAAAPTPALADEVAGTERPRVAARAT